LRILLGKPFSGQLVGAELLSQVDDFQNAYEDMQDVLASDDTTLVAKGDEIVNIVFNQIDNFLQDIKRYSLANRAFSSLFFRKVVDEIVKIGNQCCWTFNTSVSVVTYSCWLWLDSGFTHQQSKKNNF